MMFEMQLCSKSNNSFKSILSGVPFFQNSMMCCMFSFVLMTYLTGTVHPYSY